MAPPLFFACPLPEYCVGSCQENINATCTLCEENCPVYLVDKDFPGPKQAGPDAERFRVDNNAPVDEWVRKCAHHKLCDRK